MTQQKTPREMLEYLNRYIVGQNEAKRAVAVALRNRYRRQLLSEEMRNEVIPKNILMIGPTGVGKTEIARRIARLVKAPFLKVEATKFTEVGYVGRDVESMVRDLVEISNRLVKEEKQEEVKEQAGRLANDQIVKLLVPSMKKKQSTQNPFEALFGQKSDTSEENSEEDSQVRLKRSQIAEKLQDGKLENEWVTIEVTEQQTNMMGIFPGALDMGGTNMGDMLSNIMPPKKKKRRLQVKDARRILTIEEANKLIDNDEVSEEAIRRAEETGIIFIDEIDKIATRSNSANGGNANVSREGVQRDILPIVEGSTVNTKYGLVRTDFMLFIAAGAFHMSKPSDLIPELQGRFPIRVELEKLTKEDFVRILKEPDHSLILQYQALLATEGVEIAFTDEAIERIAEIAMNVNQDSDNIGARRLHTILERLLEELSFEAADISPARIEITESYVDEKLNEIVKNKDLSQFIL
ncbi:ATP-dependent protease ATPase subunit HslU [Rummeliibacillus suwonensis]|jgi:ATP-dependent HslUV protease ATP-binding subunit HslU|uniref:ATP-dependent protease ATPase subunit HslU n=1 Tax=Rummeliibacillus suwonensis TaxID=1306154 RepID=UPI0011B3FA04|nr:ATP-dependent protease ATPase subunit HslU [Rummeliibacillus suwonensis]MBO2534565.1 ATP-dependent protease ATPase subunit HslU [Rummeliibacillus suwonensis]